VFSAYRCGHRERDRSQAANPDAVRQAVADIRAALDEIERGIT